MYIFGFSQVTQSELDHDLVKTILNEYKIHNADITLRVDATAEDLIDVIEGNRVYIPCIYLLNKIDQISIEVGNLYIFWRYYVTRLGRC